MFEIAFPSSRAVSFIPAMRWMMTYRRKRPATGVVNIANAYVYGGRILTTT